MSLKYLLIAVISFFTLAGFGYWAYQPTAKVTNFSTFAGATGSVYSNRGIVDRIIKIDFSYEEGADETQWVSADITLPFDYIEKLEYKWLLAENVSLVSGELISSIDQLKANKATKIKLQVRGLVKTENRFVGLEVYGQKNSRRIYGEGLFSTQAESSFEKIVQNVERIKASRHGKSND